MDQISQTAIALLRSALWGDAFSCSADTDWAAVTRELTSEGEERELKRKCTCEFADECIRGGRQGARPGE